MIKRQIQDEIESYILSPENTVLIVEGVRQTGKTTAIQMALGQKPHVLITLSDETYPVIQLRNSKTFDEFTKILERDFQFVPDHSKILVLDEAQRSQTLYGFLMQIQKDWNRIPVILSGSVMGAFFNRPENKKTVTPAGRIKKLICRPFSFYEFLDYTGEHAILEKISRFHKDRPPSRVEHEHALTCFFQYLTTGGMPLAIAAKTINDLYTYLETLFSFFAQDADRYISEISENNRVQYGVLFRTILDAVARHTGSPTTRSAFLSTDSPAYRVTLPAMLDAMEEWHFLMRLPVKTKTPTTKQGFNSKKYLWDTGFTNHFINLSRSINASVDKNILAPLFESFAGQELLFYLKDKARLSCWKSHHKQEKEMDFLARFAEKDLGLEVKASEKVGHKAISQLAEFLKATPSATGFCLYLGEYTEVPLAGTQAVIKFIPPYLLGQLCLEHTNPSL